MARQMERKPYGTMLFASRYRVQRLISMERVDNCAQIVTHLFFQQSYADECVNRVERRSTSKLKRGSGSFESFLKFFKKIVTTSAAPHVAVCAQLPDVYRPSYGVRTVFQVLVAFVLNTFPC
jgi:hypothetical protein